MASTEATVRLPLSSGVSSLASLAVSALLLPIGCFLAGAAAVVWWREGSAELAAIPLVPGVVVLGIGIPLALHAWKNRPSDMHFGAEGFRVEGGRNDGLSVAWSALDPAQLTMVWRERSGLVTSIVFGVISGIAGGGDVDMEGTVFDGRERAAHGKLGDVVIRQLKLGDVVLAEADDEDEGDSLDEVQRILARRARSPGRRGKRGARHAAGPGVVVIACDACGGLLAPSAASAVTCPHCGATTAIPEGVRSRVEAATALPDREAGLTRTVAAILDQPSAAAASAWIAASACLFVAVAWPLTTWAAVHLWLAHTLTLPTGLLVALLPFLLVATGFCLSRIRFVDRRALAALVLHYGATAADHDGEPPTCRNCSAPLATPPDAVVVRCVFCGMPNITAVDLRGRDHVAHRTADALTADVDTHTAQRWRWRLATLASVAGLVATVCLLYPTLVASSRPPEHREHHHPGAGRGR